MRTAIPVFAIACWSRSAVAAEVDVEGYYRTRVRAFDTLSLDRELQQSEGMSAWATHRLWLHPRFVLDEHLAVHAEIRGLDGVSWGNEPIAVTDPVSGDELPVELGDELGAPSGDDAPRLDISLWRVWAEAQTDYGTFSFGRVPVHWGAGVWRNDGLGWNADHGDSVDMVRWQAVYEDVFLEVAVEANAEGFVGIEDDTMSFDGSAGYRTETVTTGLYAQYRRTPSRGFGLGTIDAAFQARLGTIEIRAEGVGQFGSGDLADGQNDVGLAAGGGILDVRMQAGKFALGVLGGAASGDKDPNDQKLRTFQFDRDYNVGLVMFEQPMPVLAAGTPNETNGGRSTQVALSTDAVRNALFVKPSVAYAPIDDLQLRGSALLARTMAMPESDSGRNGYGYELNVGARWVGWERLDVAATFGMFLPGTYYTEYADETYSGFDDSVYAGEIIGQVRF